MPQGFYQVVVSEIRTLGYEYDGNRKGSPREMEAPGTGHTTTVPRNLKSRHTANGILKDCGSKLRL
jgi:hypothetical protein